MFDFYLKFFSTSFEFKFLPVFTTCILFYLLKSVFAPRKTHIVIKILGKNKHLLHKLSTPTVSHISSFCTGRKTVKSEE